MTDPSITDKPLTETEIKEALEVAGDLCAAGVPIFAAPPCRDCGIKGHPRDRLHYRLPGSWQTTPVDLRWSDRWEPGWALAAVTGVAADVLDIDPRNGGDRTYDQMLLAGDWPVHLGRALTPSGGEHHLIPLTGEHKAVIGQGVDLQAGGASGEGRGFVFIAPTVAASKVNGRLRAYRWVDRPDVETLRDIAAGRRDIEPYRLGAVIDLARSKRTPVPRQRDPFEHEDARSSERTFTVAEAKEFIRPALMALRAAEIGEIEERANRAAVTLSHFVPDFWTADGAFALLTDALGHTAYDPDHVASTWTVEKFIPVLDGTRPTADPWLAVRRSDRFDPTLFSPDARPIEVDAPGSREEAADLVDALVAEMLDFDAVADRPTPRPLIAGLLDMDSESWLIGAPGSRKSFVALDIARCVATGTPWQGRAVTQGLVIYVVAEGVAGLGLRARAVREVHGSPGDRLRVLPRPVQAGDAVAWEVLVTACRRLKPALVILDTQARVTVGLDENSTQGIGVYIEAVSRIRAATGACVLTVHHTGRVGDNARGSSAIDGAQGTELRVRVIGDKAELRGQVVMDKQKDMAEIEGGVDLGFRVIDLGTDPGTGRALSSLVVLDHDDFLASVGTEVDRARPWLPAFGHRDRWRQLILNAIFDHAPTGEGLTKPEIKSILTKSAGLGKKSTNFENAWKSVVEQTDPDGDPVIERVRGERWDIVSLPVLKALIDLHGERGGSGQKSPLPSESH